MSQRDFFLLFKVCGMDGWDIKRKQEKIDLLLLKLKVGLENW
jgi:hypothetical protein